MMFLRKNFVAILLIVVLVPILIITPLLLSKTNDIPTRTIDVSVSDLTIEDKLEKFQEKLNSIETINENGITYLNADMVFEKIDLVSTKYEGSEVKTSYQASIDCNEDIFIIKSQTIINGVSEEEIENIFTTEYVESPETMYLVDAYGNKIDIVKEVEENNIEDCFAITISTGIAALIAGLAALIAIPPIIQSMPDIGFAVEQLVNGVVDGARTFWQSVKLAFGGITAIELPNAIPFTKELAEKIQKIAEVRRDYYLLCGAVAEGVPIPIKYKFTDEKNAANWIKKGGSVWSPFSSSARNAIKAAGYRPGGKGNEGFAINQSEWHYNKKFPTFDHYHALNKKLKKIKDIHSFYGIPYFKEEQ